MQLNAVQQLSRRMQEGHLRSKLLESIVQTRGHSKNRKLKFWKSKNILFFISVKEIEFNFFIFS